MLVFDIGVGVGSPLWIFGLLLLLLRWTRGPTWRHPPGLSNTTGTWLETSLLIELAFFHNVFFCIYYDSLENNQNLMSCSLWNTTCWLCQICYMDFFKVITWICHIWWMDFSKLLLVFVKIVNWTCQIWHMDFSKLIHGFFRIDTCTFKLLHGFVKDATRICYIDKTKLLDVFFRILWPSQRRSKITYASFSDASWICQGTLTSETIVWSNQHLKRGIAVFKKTWEKNSNLVKEQQEQNKKRRRDTNTRENQVRQKLKFLGRLSWQISQRICENMYLV